MRGTKKGWLPTEGWWKVRERSFLGEFKPGDIVHVEERQAHNYGAGGSMMLETVLLCGVREGDWEAIAAPAELAG